MKTKLFSLIIAVMASTGMIFAESGTCGQNLTWNLTNGVLVVSGTGAMTDYSESKRAPWYHQTITSLSLPIGLTTIGSYAFSECSGLTSVTIPNSVISIGDAAFHRCSGLTSVAIPGSVSVIGIFAFDRCSSLASVEIPDGVTSIGEYTFRMCSALTSVTIPNSVTSIGNNAFEGCKGLTSLEIPSNVTSIGDYAFEGCKGLTSLEIPSNVTSIGDYAFTSCSSLTSVTIPNSLTSTGEDVFGSKNNIKNVYYTGNVGEWCSKTWSAKFANGYDLYSQNTKITNLLSLPNNITSIREGAFQGCGSLTSVTIPHQVTSIGDFAFYWCTNVTSVIIHDNLTDIGNYAFFGASPEPVYNSVIFAYFPISTVTDTIYIIPDGIQTISGGAFSQCGIKTVVVPNSVTSIGCGAFGPSAIETIVCKATVPPQLPEGSAYGWSSAVLNYSVKAMYVPDESVDKYKTTTYWQDLTNILPISSLTQKIDVISDNSSNISAKTIHSGQVLIQKGDKTYTLQGQQVK